MYRPQAHLMRATRPEFRRYLGSILWWRDFRGEHGAASIMSGMEDLVVAGGVK